MTILNDSTRACLAQLTRQPDGSEVVIGNPANGLFLALSEDAVDVLDLLAAGNSISAAQEIYYRKHGEIPDVEALLEALAAKGFLPNDARDQVSEPAASIRYHFTGISETFARRVFSRPMLVGSAILCLLASAAVMAEPHLLPTRRSLLFRENVTMMLGFTMVVGLLTTFLHEMAHLVAARARGVSCRLGIGNRLWVLVAETDMTGVWALPKRDRYLPILAGPLLDLVSTAILILVRLGISRGWVQLSPTASQLVGAVAFIYMLRLIWQFFLFVRTDLYFVYTTYHGCKNLMADTQDYLKSTLARLFRRGRIIPQGHIPRPEMCAIRWYAILWLIGRTLAFAVLFLVTIPMAFHYAAHIGTTLARSPLGHLGQVVDAVVITAISLLFGVGGLSLWIKGLLNDRRKNAHPTSVQ